MMKKQALVVMAISTLLGLPSSAVAEVVLKKAAVSKIPPIESLRTDKGKERLIRQSYAAVVRYSQPSEESLSFRLSDFRTIERQAFDRHRWFDLVTMPGGASIQVTRRTMRSSETPEKRRYYAPGWAKQSDYLATAEGERLSRMSAAEAFAEGAATQQDLARVTSLTSFQVVATLNDETRTYRAAFLWIDDSLGFKYIVYDHVTDRVSEAIAERIPPGLHLPKKKIDKSGFDFTTEAFGTCSAEFVADRGFPLTASGSTGHTSGAHQLDGGASFHCYCNADCSQQCSSNVYASCSDYGDTGTCHKLSSVSEDSYDGFVSSGTASCTAGAGCAWQECFGCFCSPTLSLSAGRVGISVSTSSGAAALSKGMTFQCPAACSETDLGTGGSGGGGGGDNGGGGCSCDCDGNGLVTPSECELECGGFADVENGTCWV